MANKVGKKELKKSIERNFGVTAVCARELGIDRGTCAKYIVGYELETYRAKQRERIKDYGEFNIVTSMMGGNKVDSRDSVFLQGVYDRLRIVFGDDIKSDLMLTLVKLIKKLQKYTVTSTEKIETTKWFLERQARERGYGNHTTNVNIDREEDERTDEQIEAEIKRLEEEERINASK